MKGISLVLSLGFMTGQLAAQQADSSTFYYQKGVQERGNHLYMLAFDDLRSSLTYNPSNLNAAKEMGLTCIDLRKYDLAKDAFSKVIQTSQDDTLAVSKLATLCFWAHQWALAVQYAQKALQLHIGAGWNYILGKSYYEMEDYGQSYRYLQAATREDSTNAEIHYLIARSFVEMNNYKAAIPFFKRAIGLDSTRYEWIYECALTCATVYDDKTAIQYYQLAALKGYKKDNDFYENLSDSYVAAGQLEQGLELMLMVLEKKPADLDLLYSIANAYYKLKKFDLAIDYWDKILYFDKENSRALYMIGMSYQKKGDISKGRLLCDKAIEMDPSLRSLKTEKKIEM